METSTSCQPKQLLHEQQENVLAGHLGNLVLVGPVHCCEANVVLLPCTFGKKQVLSLGNLPPMSSYNPPHITF